MNVISFSLFGDQDKYNIGALKNIELAKIIYPDWYIVIFHDNSTPQNIIEEIQKTDTVLSNISEYKDIVPPMPGMLWRFFINDVPGVERFIVRDADSRVSMREKEAVDEWIASGKRIHVMRDHPHHTRKIFAGMFGMVNDNTISFANEITEFIKDKPKAVETRSQDMLFLEGIYDKYKHDMIVHQSIDYLNEDFAKPFLSPMQDHRFVGEIINADESREYQYTLWKDLIEKR